MPPKKITVQEEQLLLSIIEEPLIFSVGQITQYLQDLIEADNIVSENIVVRGELSNVRKASSGHYYITLKDETASISLIIWASTAKRFKFAIEDGLDVYATGKIEIYARQGSYSLICKSLEPVGVGGLQLAYEQLKKKLLAEGLFDEQYKKELPEYPKRLGIITAHTGAVIHDMLRVIRRKYPILDVLLYPVPVQGDYAAPAIMEAIQELNRPEYQLDVLIVARGGGSFEDLFCFSDERVVRAIFNSNLPIVTGVGHEPDFSLADAVADAYASTPTAAADLVVPDTEELLGVIMHYQTVLLHGIERVVHFAERALDDVLSALPQFLEKTVLMATHQLSQYVQILETITHHQLQNAMGHVRNLSGELDTLSPLKTMARGYAIVTDKVSGAGIIAIQQVEQNQTVYVHLVDGQLEATVTGLSR